jgi:DNA-binding MarR family transcriptional regulator
MSRRAQTSPRQRSAPTTPAPADSPTLVGSAGVADARLSILFDVFALNQRVRTLLQIAMHDAGMRADEYAVYSVVFESGQVTMTEMARELGMPVTTAADYVRAMTARGHVRKDAHPADQRAYLLSLTAVGVRAQKKASQSFERGYQALVRELPPLGEADTRVVLQRLTASAARAADGLSRPAVG